jgi:hypothetical protein
MKNNNWYIEEQDENWFNLVNVPYGTTYTRACWTNQCPSTLGMYPGLTSNSCPSGTTEALNEPNCSTDPNMGNGLTAGVTNQGQNPSGSCPCEYNMNCWSQTCPSTMTTHSGLPGMSCPSNTQNTPPNCMVNPNTNPQGLNVNWPGSTQTTGSGGPGGGPGPGRSFSGFEGGGEFMF